jgi:uncharacterized protein
MKLLSILLLALMTPILAIAEDYAPITLGGTELRPLTSKINGRPYELWIAYPYSYETDTEKTYPVIYMLDGYWDAPVLITTYGNMIYDKTVPEFIIVGIGYSDHTLDYDVERSYDLTPMATKMDREGYGGGNDFFKVIKEEIIPYVDANLRTDPEYRVLGGTSLGGFFTLYTMFTEPELFDAYIAISPAVGLADRWLFNYESNYHQSNVNQSGHKELPVRLFMSGADKEWTGFFGDILAFDQILKHGEYEDLEYQFRVIDDEKHAGTKPEGYSRSVRFAFRPYLEKQLNEAKPE